VLADELARLTPGDDDSERLRAEFADREGRSDDSVRWLSRATKTAPNRFPDTYVFLGSCYQDLGDMAAAVRQYERARNLSPTNMWATAALAESRAASGDAEGALVLLRDGLRRYPNDADLRRTQASYHYYFAETEQALTILREAEPLLFADSPELETDGSYWYAPMAAFLSLRSGDTRRASTIAATFYNFTDRWAGPARKGAPDVMRVKMAAALGDRAGVLKYLDATYTSGSALWALIPEEPLFQAYKKDPEIAARLAKHAERRAKWRQQLAAEGL
jgi:tetratricopeptide (TPR) repeat protein